ncbi:MAG TPA: outer membrane beta-barrel protein [Gemmatimonadales bacterium]|nr:outer membrane beta-barrel protein [Gemmatimonadales bacterium]
MRRPYSLALLLVATTVAPAQAQTTYYVRGGVTWSSDIVRDVFTAPVTTRPGLAPTLFAGVDFALSSRYSMGLEASASTASLTTTTPSIPGSDIDQGRIWTLGALVNMSGDLARSLRWRAGLGVLHYSGPSDAGIFAQGGTMRALFGAGMDYQLSDGRAWNPVVSLRYDYHRFVTDELRAQGFGLEQGVNRISLSIGVRRGSR